MGWDGIGCDGMGIALDGLAVQLASCHSRLYHPKPTEMGVECTRQRER